MDTAILSVLFGWAMGDAAPTGADDAALVVSGDRDAFARLITRHQRAVYRLAARLLGAGDDAREAAQVAFVRAWERRGSFDASRDFGAWVLGIVRNEAIDRLRSRSRTAVLEDDALEAADPAPSVDQAIEALGAEEALGRAVAELRPLYREVIELCYAQERSVAQAASILGVPQGTVMARLFRARRLLRTRLGDDT